MKRILLVIILFLLTTGNVRAGELEYNCEVIRVYTLSENGTLRTSEFEKQMKQSSFSVSRATGEISGKIVPTLLANSTRVVSNGSPEDAFKAIAYFGDQFQVLEIQEFHSGTIKPFIAMSMGGAGIITGICR